MTDCKHPLKIHPDGVVLNQSGGEYHDDPRGDTFIEVRVHQRMEEDGPAKETYIWTDGTVQEGVSGSKVQINTPSKRRSGVCISFESAMPGKKWICIYQHKGRVYAEWRVLD
jgi:hypothetical protein